MTGRVPGAWAAAKAAVALALALVLAACDLSALMPKEHVDFAKAVVMLVQNRDAEGLEAVSDARLWPQLTPELREHMASAFPRTAPMSVNVASYHVSTVNGVSDVAIVLRYIYPHSVVNAAVSFRSAEHGYVLTGIRVAAGDAPAPNPSSEHTIKDL